MTAVVPKVPADAVCAGSRPGRGLLVAVLLLALVELGLHTDAFLYRFRSVFAAGRAFDKLQYVETHTPDLLILGNSRADNGFNPRIVVQALGVPLPRGAFNLGMPGADARVLDGVITRLDRNGRLGPRGVHYVVLLLDEALVQSIDSLGQEIFFASPSTLWADGQYHDALRAVFRLYGFSANLAQLREPAVLERFVRAIFGDVDPVGGGAAEHLGYRAGFGGLQDAQAARLQDAEAVAPPSPVNERRLLHLLDRLAERGVRVAIVFPPLRDREVQYISSGAEGAPYRAFAEVLRHRGLPMIALDHVPHDPSEFVNPGHLNDRGAQRYSVLLGRSLSTLWRRLPAGS
jgi:hypothetical protein